MTKPEDWYNKGYWFGTRGYVWSNGKYLAAGTYPGCVRGSDTDYQSILKYKLTPATEREIICNSGYRPDEWVSPTDDGTVDFEALWEYLLNNMPEDLDKADSFKNSKYCREFFNESSSVL